MLSGLSPGFFVGEVIYGRKARRSVHLTQIGPSSGESVSLAKTENRLSRNLARPADPMAVHP